ncbi:MAG: hypothetical protein OXC62_07075 [Aestuariivita sp.]|nr:hypothetical protein [Aestuariivita sp.]
MSRTALRAMCGHTGRFIGNLGLSVSTLLDIRRSSDAKSVHRSYSFTRLLMQQLASKESKA